MNVKLTKNDFKKLITINGMRANENDLKRLFALLYSAPEQLTEIVITDTEIHIKYD